MRPTLTVICFLLTSFRFARRWRMIDADYR